MPVVSNPKVMMGKPTIAGDPVWQVAPGTAFADLPDHWRCPNCDGAQEQFMLLDV